ncbi:hypothetical protein H4219_001228 [Mycoemilia scoparia]|uniref:Uncharacterized protein n=1 Tax=Mycoemilia scoparia TaxID=417184 RepID=A0A9W8A6E7_9FUNG|nr:hypothetical protein H4219_001228 [Mycoemilia scoparia]
MFSRITTAFKICQPSTLRHLSSSASKAATAGNGIFGPITKTLNDGSLFVSRVPDAKTYEAVKEEDLPPAIGPMVQNKKHLTASDVQEIRRLRNEDPAHWTRSRLAKRFDCNPVFIGMVSKCPEWRLQEIQKENERKWLMTGYKRRLIKINRLRRRMALAGLILAHQLWYQICLGTYFILVDIVIFFQWAYYDYLGLSAISNISSVVFKGEQPQKASQPRSEMVQATAVTTETSPLMASSPSYSTHSMNSVNSDCSTAPLSLSVIHKKMTKLSIALATAATIITVVIYILTHSKAITNYVEYNREYIGQMFGWLCNIMYWSSRIPQAYKNYKRKSVSGVSFMTFLTIFSGNVTNCISIALQYPTAPDDYIRSSRPFIIGPAGSVFIDFFFLSQLLYYTELDKKRHRLAAKAGRMEDAVAE